MKEMKFILKFALKCANAENLGYLWYSKVICDWGKVTFFWLLPKKKEKNHEKHDDGSVWSEHLFTLALVMIIIINLAVSAVSFVGK